jgi:hypothetical protein
MKRILAWLMTVMLLLVYTNAGAERSSHEITLMGTLDKHLESIGGYYAYGYDVEKDVSRIKNAYSYKSDVTISM